jgi:tRNA (adenine37-N6)-methyltransferase
VLADSAAASIELFSGRGYEHALEGLASWEYVWVLFVFHKNVEDGRGWRPKVLPPRSAAKRGVFATRSPYRPNPLGLSAAKIDRIEGCVVHVHEIDLLDGTPVLDLKPYVAYADARPQARAGWLKAEDPLPAWQVELADEAHAQITWLSDRGVDLQRAIESTLALGPHPHPYRRIRPAGSRMRLALKEWRVDFEVRAHRILVCRLSTGYRATQRASDPSLALHAEFAQRWP